MANFFSALNEGLAYGVQGQQINLDVEAKQQQVAAQKMQLMQAQQEQDTRQGIGSYIQSQMQKDSTIATDPVKLMQLYSTAGAQALQKGDFRDASLFDSFSKSARQDAAAAQEQAANKQQAAKETLSNSALDYQQNPTPENASAMARAAVAAGVNPLDIPPPGPKLAAFATQHGTDAESSKTRIDGMAKVTAAAKLAEAKKAEFDQGEKDKLEQRQQTAKYQNNLVDIDRERLKESREKAREESRKDALLNRERELRVGEMEAKQKYGSERQQAYDEGAARGVSNAILDLKRITALGAGQTSSPFSVVGNKSLTDGFVKTAGNALTDSQTQMYNASLHGLALAIAQAETSTPGSRVNNAIIHSFEDSAKVQTGESPITAAYRMTLMTDRLQTILRNTRELRDPTKQKERLASEEWLKNKPTGEDIIESVRKHKGEAFAQSLANSGATLGESLNKLVQSAKETTAPAGGGNGLSASQNALIDSVLQKK